MYGANEDQELRNLYQFGQQDSTAAPDANQDESSTAGGGGNGEPDYMDTADESYSPRAVANNGAPASPAAFAQAGDSPAIWEGGSGGTSAGNIVAAAANGQHHKEGSKKNVMKKILGTDKKSTKNMTDEEKKAFKLQERWKNALLEEQRLNELDHRIAQEETLTGMIGQAPNFPPKILCIKPLVYHNISAVRDDRRLFVKMAFWDWVAVCIILFANCPITIACNYAPYKSSIDRSTVHDINKGLNIVLACVYLVGIPLSFLCWYFPIYKSNFDLVPTQHVVAVCGLIIALAQAIFAFVGPYSYGFCGILSSKWVGETRERGVVAPMAIVTALWGMQAIFTVYMICQEFIYYRRDLAARRAERRHRASPAA